MIKLDILDIIKHLQKDQKNTEPLMEFAQKIKETLAATSVPKGHC